MRRNKTRSAKVKVVNVMTETAAMKLIHGGKNLSIRSLTSLILCWVNSPVISSAPYPKVPTLMPAIVSFGPKFFCPISRIWVRCLINPTTVVVNVMAPVAMWVAL